MLFPRRGAFTAMCLSALALVSAASSRADAQTAPESSKYGIVDGAGVSTTAAALARAREAGIGWVRLDIFWNRINPRPGEYHWDYVDTELGYIEAAGMNVYAHVMWPPAWATGVSYGNDAVPFFCLDPTQQNNVRNHADCGNPLKVPDTSAFLTFVETIVQRYKDRIRHWGFGVEVHSAVFWNGPADQFVRDYLTPAYNRIKSIDSALMVVGPDEDKATSLDELLRYEAIHGRFADILSFHILRHSLPDGSMVNRLNELKPVIDNRGQGRAVWLTELGMQAATDDCLTNGIAGEWLRLQLEELKKPEYGWISKAFVFSLRDSTRTEDFGIVGPDDAPKPTWYAVRGVTGAAVNAQRSYLAEGATGFFKLDVALANPSCQPAPVRLTYLLASGQTLTQDVTVPGKARRTIRVNDRSGLANAATSIVIDSTNGVPITSERMMMWGANDYGGHGGSAVVLPSTTWYFAEGSQGFFDTYLLLANSSTSTANVSVSFLRESEAPITRQYRVAPTSRFNVYAGDDPELRGRSFAMTVTSDVAIIAERAMYFGAQRFWDAGHESAGVAEPARSWFHAEGATGPYFDTYILVANPNDSAATVTLRFLLESGTTIERVKVVGARRRLTIDVEAEAPELANAAVSTTVSSDLPIVSERAMYWPGTFVSWHEAHNSFGVTSTGTQWALAEGRVGGSTGFETYILLANPGSTPARVQITYLRESGSPVTKTYTVGASSRLNVYVNGMVPELRNESFGAFVESIDGVPIVVERALYWNSAGQTWAGGTNVTATRLR